MSATDDQKQQEGDAANCSRASGSAALLREFAIHQEHNGNRFHAADLRRIADEIDRLRHALTRIRDDDDSGEWPDQIAAYALSLPNA